VLSILNDPDTDTVSDFKRDRWGRPLIMQADGTRKPYTRASSATKAIDDTWNLDQWDRRNVAYGIAHDASLVARLLAIGGDPSTWGKQDKDAVGKVVDDARTGAKAHKGADIGTALHRIIERIKRGEPVDAGPYQADVDAYFEALDACGLDILPEFLEVRLVCDELELAGSADDIVGHGEKFHIADLKTGATVEYGVLGFAGQLAAYANGKLYDVDAEERLPTPELDDAVGYIIHLPAGEGRCTIYELDLVQGYRAARIARHARVAQKEAKRWLTPCSTVKAEKPTTMDKATVVATLGYNHDEGRTLDADSFVDLQALHASLPTEAQQWFHGVTAEADRAGVPFRAKDNKTLRRYEIYRGLLLLAQAEWGAEGMDEIVRALVALALGTDAPLFPCITTGHAVGAMGATEAAKFARLCVDYVDGGLTASFQDDGLMRLVRAA
jgi:hypothetical protein